MSGTTFTQRLWIGGAAIVLFLLVVLCALGLPVLVVWPWWVIGAVVALALILALPVFLIRRWIAGKRPGWSPAASFISIAAVLFMATTAVVAFPLYYMAYLVDARPTTMPLVTLTDGKKTVQFQGMQHIGSETFYKSVVYDLREALDYGYRLYYEGVQPVEGRPDLTQWFDRFATGGDKDLSASYKTLADSCGMQFQLDYFKGLTKDFVVHPDRHVTADVTYLDLKTEFERLLRDDPAFAKEMGSDKSKTSADSKENESIVSGFLNFWKAGTPDQRKLLGFACRGFFSWSFAQQKEPSQKDKVILVFRNGRLARAIADAKEDKIWITYGAAHIPGVIADLQKINPDWRVVSTKWSRVIANPEEWAGELR